MIRRALTIAGSDPSGGAGLQADLKTFSALGIDGCAVVTALNLKKVLAGSSLYDPGKKKVQDAYSMRSTPQVIGAAHDAVAWARSQVETELNGVGDNPVFFPEISWFSPNGPLEA